MGLNKADGSIKLVPRGHRENLKKAARAAKNDMLNKVFQRGDNSRLLWGLLHIKIVGCTKLRNLDKLGLASLLMKGQVDKSDPYVLAFIGDYRILKTRHINDDLNPVFDEEFYCPVAHFTEGIRFKVKDKDLVKDESLGKYFLPISEFLKAVDDIDLENTQTWLQGI